MTVVWPQTTVLNRFVGAGTADVLSAAASAIDAVAAIAATAVSASIPGGADGENNVFRLLLLCAAPCDVCRCMLTSPPCLRLCPSCVA